METNPVCFLYLMSGSVGGIIVSLSIMNVIAMKRKKRKVSVH